MRGLLVVSVFALLGKSVSTVKEMAVAWRFGVGAEIDAYMFVYNLASWPVSVWTGVLAVTLIPVESRARLNPGDGVSAFRAEQLGFTLVFGASLMAAVAAGLFVVVNSQWVGLPARTAQLASALILPTTASVLPGLLVGLFSAWLMSEGKHANTLLEAVPAICILVATLVIGTVHFLALGALAGTMMQALILLRLSGSRGAGLRPRLRFEAVHWGVLRNGFSVMLLGQLVMSLTSVMDQFFAARLGEGAISSVGYANRIVSLVVGLAATAVTRATLPVFSAISSRDVAEAVREARKWALRLGVAGVIVTAVGCIGADIAVRLLFERGTFDAADSASVVGLTRAGLLQLPFYISSLVFVSLHSSAGQFRVLFLSGVLGLAVKGLAVWLTLPILGPTALMLSSSFVYLGSILLLSRFSPK